MAPDARIPDAPGLLFVAGMNHRTAPVAVREQLALEEEKIREILADLTGRGFLHEVMILSTCNRVEVYGVAAVPGEARAPAFSRLGSHRGMAVAGAGAAALHRDRRRGRAPRLPRRGEPRLHGAGRAADPRTGEGRLRAGPIGGHRGPGAARPDEPGVQRGQAGAIRDGGGPPRGLDLLRRGGAGAEDLRGARGQVGPAGRRGRDERAGRAAPDRAGRAAGLRGQPHLEPRPGAGPRARRGAGALRSDRGDARPGGHRDHLHRGAPSPS